MPQSTPPLNQSHSHEKQPVLRRAPGIRLQQAETELLLSAFIDADTLFVEREFRSGYSGALVLLISVDSGRAPVVVKLAHPLELRREYDAYHAFVLQHAPQNTARLRGAPIFNDDGTLGLLIYTFAGGNTQQPSSSLYDYYLQNGGRSTAEVLNRVFRIYGRHWWAVNRPRKFVLAEEYDRLLPVHLYVESLHDTRPSELVLEAGEVSAVDLRDIPSGTRLELRGFHVASVDSAAASVKLTADPPQGEASAAIRIRVAGMSDIAFVPGKPLASLHAQVTATRLDLLSAAATVAVPWFSPTEPDFALPGQTLQGTPSAMQRNPLFEFDALMDRVLEARFSTVHGDLNLQNILVDQPTGFAWLIDFADTRVGPTLFDLQRLEVQVITKLLPQEADIDPAMAAALHGLLVSLHADPPAQSTSVSSLSEPYAMLVGLRRLARQYLMDDLEWDEYYAGLIVALVGALKFDELNDHARLLALSAAASLTGLLGRAPFAALAAVPPMTVPALTIPPPPEPARPPQLQEFVGRAQELTDYADALEQKNLAIISGMAGVGKTALATELIRWVSQPEQILWHSFREGDGLDTIIWKLAAFLAWHGHDDLWLLLESARLTGGKAPQSDTLFEYLFQLLRGRDLLICFDDYHMVDDDPSVTRLVERLLPLLAGSRVRLLLTTRRQPSFAQVPGARPLSGLNAGDTRRLLAARGLNLSAEVIDELHMQTGGNAQFLTLAVDILHQATDPVLLLDRLAATSDMERYLLAAVDEGLTGSERSVLQVVATFLGHSATRDALEAVMNAGSAWRTLRMLHERHLLVVIDSEEGREYVQHAILREFYYQEIGRRQRRVLHQRAGAYYESEEPDPLRAGIHYERAAAYELAVRQATADVWAIINRGQARLLRSLLERFDAALISPQQWAEVNNARGAASAFLDDREAASESYHRTLEALAQLPQDERLAALKAQAFRGMAELLELENPTQAIDWIERAFDEVPTLDETSRSALLIKRGTAEMYLGRYTDAQCSLETGLDSLPATASQLRGLALSNLGSVHFYRGNLATALLLQEQALDISQQLHDRFRVVNTLSNLGVSKYCQGEWQGAIADFEAALEIARDLGSAQLEAEVGINLGGAFVNTGDDVEASTQLTRSLELASAGGLPVLEAFAAFRMADLEIRLGRWAAATIQLSRAEQIAQELNQRGLLISIYRGRAEVHQSKGEADRALSCVLESTRLADELSETLEKGESLRTLGVILRDTGERQAAREALEQSLALLAEEDPYEAARTMTELGLLLLESDQASSALALIDEATTTFERLGAQRDLRRVKEMGEPRTGLV
jgi:ATP/maltotriose-dependent transcriptional regulator MalT